MSPRPLLALPCVVLLAALTGCGGSSTPSASSPSSPSLESPASAASDESTALPKGPQAFCDEKPTWEQISDQLTQAEGALDNGPLWTDTASAFGAHPAPDAVANSWGPLSAKVATYATAASSGDPASLQSAQTLQLPEIKQLHQLIDGAFDQLC